MKRPDLRRCVAVCMACRNWQIDVRPGAISDLGGWEDALRAMAEAHALGHLPGCPGAGGRIKYDDRWVEAPKMSDGKAADGTLAIQEFPLWWVPR